MSREISLSMSHALSIGGMLIVGSGAFFTLQGQVRQHDGDMKDLQEWQEDNEKSTTELIKNIEELVISTGELSDMIGKLSEETDSLQKNISSMKNRLNSTSGELYRHTSKSLDESHGN